MNRSPRKKYTPEFKQQAVELVRLGKSVPEVTQELNIGDGILYAWVKKSQNASQLGSESQGAVGDMTAADELRRLRREIAHLKLENDILKKAAVILGTNPQPRTITWGIAPASIYQPMFYKMGNHVLNTPQVNASHDYKLIPYLYHPLSSNLLNGNQKQVSTNEQEGAG